MSPEIAAKCTAAEGKVIGGVGSQVAFLFGYDKRQTETETHFANVSEPGLNSLFACHSMVKLSM